MPERKPYASPRPYEDPEVRRSDTAETTMGDLRQAKRDPYAAFRFPAFVFYSIGNCISIAGRQMLTVAVEWEIYARTHSATALGLAGAAIATPVVLLSLPAGHIADRYSRKTIIILTQAISAVLSVALALVSWKHLELPRLSVLISGNDLLRSVATVFERHATFQFDDLSLPLIYFLLFATTAARTFGWAARAAFLPLTVPREVFPNAATWNSSIFQLSCVVGPAAAGFLIVRAGFPFIYALESICALCFLSLILPIKKIKQGARVTARALHSLRDGLRFVWNKKAILATLTLDMFAVLLGGATVLLPVFAKEILHCGPIGLGWLRASPAIGAIITGILVAYLPPMRRAGRTFLWCVIGFGLATIVFGLSKSFWLSLAMLFLTGAFDSVSVIVRHTLVQLLTPDEMRGRISAVNNIFIGTSNEFGALESGLTAALFGPVISVVAGGIGTILVVLGVAAKWPQVRKIGALDRTLGSTSSTLL